MNRLLTGVTGCRVALWLLSVMIPSSLVAATLDGTYTEITSSNATADLTALGQTDWAYWDTGANPATGVPANRKLGGSLIGDIYPIGGSGLRGSSSTTQPENSFTFSDGTSPMMGSVSQPTGVFNQTLDSNGTGVGLDILLPSANATYTVSVFGAAFGGDAEFTAMLDGAMDYTNTTLSDTGSNPKDAALYTLEVVPDSPGDILSLSMLLQNSTSQFGHTLINGVAVTQVNNLVPEPVSIAIWTLLGLSLAGFGYVRRQRN